MNRVRAQRTGRSRRNRPLSGSMAMVGGLLALTGCEGLVDVASNPVVAGSAAINAISVVTTDKSVPDHVVGLVTGHDCSIVRYSTGGYYCVQPLPANSPVETRLFCYNSIGAITCYDEPIPGEDARLVSDPRHVLSSRDIGGPMVGPMPGQR